MNKELFPQLRDDITMGKIGEHVGGLALETVNGIEVRYVGRVDFGQGNIDATDVSMEEATKQAETVAREGLIQVTDYKDEYGGCMDGRDNDVNELGQGFPPRPKVIGGPSVFGWYVAAIGDFLILSDPDVNTPLKQFKIVNERLKEAGFKLGMHYECGAARGVKPVVNVYNQMFEGISELSGEDAKKLAENDERIEKIRAGIQTVQNELAEAGEKFTEGKMHNIVRTLDGKEALIHLKTDHNHPNHGHEEQMLLRLRTPHTKIDKPTVISKGVKAFYSNEGYASALVEALAQTDEERARGLIIADHLPLAGVATLGRGQHVIELD